jgi:spermidine synthase
MVFELNMMTIGKEVFRTYDEHGLLRVFDDGPRRYLSFGDDDEQSCQLKAEPILLQHDYTRAMLLVLLFSKPKKVMQFGLGGGCLVTTLQHCCPGLKITAVELRHAVVKIAHRFFKLPRSKAITLVTQDVGEFIEEEHKRVDVIFSDIYSAEGLDMQQAQPWFIERCAQLLKDDGWLVLNCWQQHRGEQDMLRALNEHFADVRVCTTAEGNWVVLAGKKSNTKTAAVLKQEAKLLSKSLGYSLPAYLSRLRSI